MNLVNQTGQVGDLLSVSGNNLSRISQVTFSGGATGRYDQININTLSVETVQLRIIFTLAMPVFS